MAVYRGDDPALFRAALESVFQNTLLPTACLVVADGPLSEPLDAILADLSAAYPAQMQSVRLPINLGLAGALNAGLGQIKTQWVVRADADDRNLPHRFATLAKTIQAYSDLELLGSFALEVDEHDASVGIREVPIANADIREFCKTRNPFNHMTVAYRLKPVLKLGGYPSVYLREDYALWAKLLRARLPMMNIDQVLVHANAGHGMYKRRGGWRYAKAEWEMQKLLIESGLKGALRALLDGLMRTSIFMMPAALRGLIYRRLLRKSADLK